MTYNVFHGTLNLTQLQLQGQRYSLAAIVTAESEGFLLPGFC